MNIAIQNGYDDILYSFKKKELIQRKQEKLLHHFLLRDEQVEEEELWIDVPHQKYVTLVEDDRRRFFHVDVHVLVFLAWLVFQTI